MKIPAGTASAEITQSTAAAIGRALLHGLIFLAALLAVTSAIGLRLPFPQMFGVAAKYRYLESHLADFDTLFVGSSRFNHQIVAKQFDHRIAALNGHKTRSFNFGVDGMWPPESLYVVRKILALRPPNLRWVVVDLMDLDCTFPNRANITTVRSVYWHDLRHTCIALKDIIRSPKYRNLDRTGLVLDHAGLFLRQTLNLGRGAEWLGAMLEGRSKKKPRKEFDANAGFDAGPEKSMEPSTRPEYEGRVKNLSAKMRAFPISQDFRAALRDLVEDICAAGAMPIFVQTPTVNPLENFSELPDGVVAVRFNEPAKYPHLYDPELYYDFWHLNPKGAELFTDLLAERMAPLLKTKK